ncbi:hypothetical protein [Actinokineospora inagensis]|uniref:hypothetical protein n=1 Tax=Actinokineospora inagensis TaxID=103730 RepID=UPI00040CC7B3|nr:hypothetical protein [Actinokineospora inagensis]
MSAPKPDLPDDMGELIADCAAIPPALTRPKPALPIPRTPTRWTVDDACHAQVADLDEYV